MSIFRADFEVQTSAVLPDGSPPMVLRSYGGEFEIILSNAARDIEGHAPFLNVAVIGPCESLDIASTALRAILVAHLDVLTFVTHSRLQIIQCRRVLEWVAFQKSRMIKVMAKFEADYPPSPDLAAEFVNTANAIIEARPADFVRRALHYFRMGVLGRQPEDQFQQFWLVIETIAENRKDRTEIRLQCRKCAGTLRCEACDSAASRRPMAIEAIREIIKTLKPEGGVEQFDRLNAVRNQIIHARPIGSIERDLGCPLGDVVNEAAKIAWCAIEMAMPPTMEGEFHFGHMGGDFTYRELVVGSIMGFEHEGPDEHPAEDKIPGGIITLQTRFGDKLPVPKQE